MNDIKTKVWEGEIPVHYLYTFGIAGEKFFRAIKERGVFTSSRCESCDVTYLPPRTYCERCMAELTEQKDAGSKGVVGTFTICHEAQDGSRLKEPQILAQVTIDGSDGSIIHRLSGVTADAVKIGMKVEAVFAEPSKRSGGIGDILHFRPV